jgi:hypothetical protein
MFTKIGLHFVGRFKIAKQNKMTAMQYMPHPLQPEHQTKHACRVKGGAEDVEAVVYARREQCIVRRGVLHQAWASGTSQAQMQ